MTKAVLAALGFLVVIRAAGAGARAPEPDSPPALDDLLEPIREKHDLPALAGGIISRGSLVESGAVGVRAKNSSEPVTTEDLWHLGSCTKAITATLIAVLADWSKFIAVHVAGARGETDFLKPETFAKLHTPPDDGDYALGWMVTRRPWAGGVALTHTGSNSMWFAVTWLAPGKDFAVMAVTNSGGSSAPAAYDEAVGAMIQSFLDR